MSYNMSSYVFTTPRPCEVTTPDGSFYGKCYGISVAAAGAIVEDENGKLWTVLCSSIQFLDRTPMSFEVVQ